ncbi:MAG: carbamoyl transferase, partial [Candidatus Parvarchaeota archaeon]|nr:carbamoyl transferase [Candidatus Jingweiarchaeum tengchongense]
GLSGSICVGKNGKIERIKEFPANVSLGILYGAVTYALDMKYSEDELKVMSLAPYSYSIEIPELDKIISVKDGNLIGKLPVRYELLLAEWIKNHLLWKYGREALAYGIQRHLEKCVCEIVRKAIDETGIKDIALAGGIFSNVILNMAIRKLPEVRNVFVFPHMGDGGLAAGAALLLDYELNKSYKKEQIKDVYLGPEFSNEDIEKELLENRDKIKFEERSDISEYVADFILNEKIVLWFQGRMEYGPRALGNRSILSPAWSKKCKDELNLIIKRRPYFQPFCPTILEEDANKLLEDYDNKPNRFMTMAYIVREDFLKEMEAVTHIDRTTRPQMLLDENPRYRKVLEKIKKKTGTGTILNTSLNKHGYAIVCTPKQAIWTLLNSGAKYIAIGDFFVEKLANN